VDRAVRQAYGADDVALPQHRHGEDAARAARAQGSARLVRQGELGRLDVADARDVTGTDPLGRRALSAQGPRPRPSPHLELGWGIAVVGDRVHELAVETIGAAVRRARQ